MMDEDDLISTVTFDDLNGLESPHVQSTVSGFEPNAAARRLLAQSWKTLSGEQQLQIRSNRAKRGIKCIVCGAVGYFRENCPNQCQTPPSTPESWESTPPSTPPQSPPNTPPPSFGLYWGASNDKSRDKPKEVKKKSSYDYRKTVDVGIVRPQAQRVQETLRSNDEKIGSFQFFTLADDGYCATFSQLSLHQLMRRLMRLIEKQLLKNATKLEASFDTTLLHPPSERHLGPTFYPEELLKVPEYRDQLLSMDKKKDTRRKHQNQASLRPVDELDPLFRGGGAIKFNDDFLYTTNPKAGASIHSKNTWKSVLAKNDGLASSDPTMARKQLEIDKLFEHQSKWIAMQKTDMAYTNDRYEHVVSIIRNELKKEHAREARLLHVDKYTKKATQMKVYQEQLESVDTIMRCLHCYNLTTAIDQADFLLFTLERWKEILQSKIRAASSSSSSSSAKTRRREESVSDAADESADEASAPSSRLGRTSSQSNRASVVNKSSTANKPSKKKGSQGGNHNNSMVASADPYANDKEFLEALNKKLDRRRIRAQRPPKFAPKAVHRALDLDVMDDRTSSVDIIADEGTDSTRGVLLLSSGSERIGSSSRSVTRGGSSSSAALGLSMTNADEVDEQKEGRGSTARVTISRMTATLPSRQLKQRIQAPVLAAADILTSINESKAYSDTFNDSVAHEEKVKQLMQGSKKLNNFVVKPRIHPRQLDDMKMNEAKRAFRAAGLKDHIRQGQDSDLAYLAPTLIPVPGAFQADGSNPMVSHTAENIMFAVKKSMTLADLGYTPQKMIPLYVRNTLMEKNGTTPGGDQAYMEAMSADRRYTHYMGRPLNRFEPDGDKAASQTMSGLSIATRPDLIASSSSSTLSKGGSNVLSMQSPMSSIRENASYNSKTTSSVSTLRTQDQTTGGSQVSKVHVQIGRRNQEPDVDTHRSIDQVMKELKFLDEF